MGSFALLEMQFHRSNSFDELKVRKNKISGVWLKRFKETLARIFCKKYFREMFGII